MNNYFETNKDNFFEIGIKNSKFLDLLNSQNAAIFLNFIHIIDKNHIT